MGQLNNKMEGITYNITYKLDSNDEPIESSATSNLK